MLSAKAKTPPVSSSLSSGTGHLLSFNDSDSAIFGAFLFFYFTCLLCHNSRLGCMLMSSCQPSPCHTIITSSIHPTLSLLTVSFIVWESYSVCMRGGYIVYMFLYAYIVLCLLSMYLYIDILYFSVLVFPSPLYTTL